MKIPLFISFLIYSVCGLAQPEGDTFPDFTETDINGVEHSLSDYLSEGKTVVIDVFATWCSTCIASLPGIHSLEETYGEDIVVLSFEKDSSTNNEASWAVTHDVTTPIFSNSVSTIGSWNIVAQPNFFVICPDGSFELKTGGIGSDPSILSGYVDVCLEAQANGVEEQKLVEFTVLGSNVSTELRVNSNSAADFEIFSITGKKHLEGNLEENITTIDVLSLSPGIYLLKAVTNGQQVVKKFIKQ